MKSFALILQLINPLKGNAEIFNCSSYSADQSCIPYERHLQKMKVIVENTNIFES